MRTLHAASFLNRFCWQSEPRGVRGTVIGAAVGAAAGGYVGYLPQNYADNDSRLERLRAGPGGTEVND